jgi:hypothetical protein
VSNGPDRIPPVVYAATPEQRHAASLTICSHAHSPEEARLFLDMLGLTE